MSTFIIRDVRLEGWKPPGDVIEVNFDTPLQWLVDSINKRASSDLKVIIMCHGLPGYLQCANGIVGHPTVGNGITDADIPMFEKIAGSLWRLELYSCLVARIGGCPESGNDIGYDGNAFCFKLAQAIKAQVKASIHLQYYNDGTVGKWVFRRPNGKGINFRQWNGTVFTWNKNGKIISTEVFPYES
ncbi:MAG: hypothetical protein ACR2MG_18060 [Pyrinomonadaceae bacterium]